MFFEIIAISTLYAGVKAYDQNKENFPSSINQVKESFSSSVSQVKENFSSSVSQAKESFPSSVSQVKENFSSSVNQAKESFPSSVSQVKEGLFSSIRNAKDTFPASASQVKANFQQFKAEGTNVFSAKKEKIRATVLTIPADEPKASEEEQLVRQNLMISSFSLATASAAFLLFNVPLLVLGAVPAVIVTVPIYQAAYDSVLKDGEIGVAALDSATFTIALVTGQFWALSLAPFCYYYSRDALIKREKQALQDLITPFEQPNNLALIDGSQISLPVNKLNKGEIILVSAGEYIPVDGSITSGSALVDQRYLTGDPFPIEKKVGQQVFASSIVLAGCLSIIVEKTSKETKVAQLKEILSNTAESRASLRVAGKTVADRLTFPTLTLGLLTYPFLGLVSMGNIFNADLGYQMGALGPIGMLNHLQVATEKGILFKNANALALLNLVNTVVLEADALLEELPEVSKIKSFVERSEDDLLRYAAAVYKQGDPITTALRQSAHQHKLSIPHVGDAKVEMENGVKAKLSGTLIRVGDISFMEKERVMIPSEVRTQWEVSKLSGSTLLLIAIGRKLSGTIELEPRICADAYSIVSELKERRLSLLITSTHSEEVTQKLAQALQIEQYLADVSSQDKVHLFERLIAEGSRACYVGDKIQEPEILKMIPVSISLRASQHLVSNKADVILLDESLKKLVDVFEIANRLAGTIASSLTTTTIPGILGATGTILFGLGLIPSIILNHIGLRIGYLNVMEPLNSIQPDPIESTLLRPSNPNRKLLTNKQ